MKRILAIDDQKDNLLMINEVVKKFLPNCNLLIAQSGKEGLEIAQKEQPDTIILDIIMPKMDGYETCVKLKSNELTKHIPVIMLTALKIDTESKIKGLNSGADAFLSKPIDFAEFSAQIKAMLRIKEAEDKLRQEKLDLDELVREGLKYLTLINKRLQKEVYERKKSENELRALFKAMRNVVIELDYDGKYINIAPSSPNLLYKPSNKLIGKTLHETFPKPDADKFLNLIRQSLDENKTEKLIYKLKIKDELIWFEGTATPKTKNTVIFIAQDISEHKLTESELDIQKAYFKHIFDVAPVSIAILDNNDRIVQINKEFTNLFEFTEEEAKGKLINDLVVPPELYKDGENNTKLALNGQFIFKETIRQTKSGKRINVLIIGKSINLGEDQLGIYAIYQNITEKKKAEDALLQNEKKMRTILDASPDIIIQFDTDLRFQWANKIVRDAFPDVYGKTCKQAIFGTKERCTNCPCLKSLSSGNTEREIILHKQAKIASTEVNYWDTVAVPIKDNEGNVVSVVEIARDITEKTLADNALKEYANELKERNEELDAFAHTVAHDLKNPLGIVIGFSELIEEGFSELSENEICTYVKTIKKDSVKMNSIIENLLLLSSLRKTEIKTESLNMSEIVNDAIDRNYNNIDKSNAEINLHDSFPNVLGFAPWVEEVWTNFISNAIKYGGNPPKIEIGADNIETNISSKKFFRFWVRDNGNGISSENQKLLFKQFERLEETKIEGHGLGLSIVKRIIDKLGGQIGVESELGKGSTFYFTLPCEAD
ncbi:MAG: PAS domain S-box protein [Bacteroidales bacterium]|nr:PAS domain S-box protein [Bacteroidales bacterium]